MGFSMLFASHFLLQKLDTMYNTVAFHLFFNTKISLIISGTLISDEFIAIMYDSVQFLLRRSFVGLQLALLIRVAIGVHEWNEGGKRIGLT